MFLLTTLALAFLAPFQQNPEDGRGQSIFTAEWHAGRRAALMEQVKKGVVVLRGAPTLNDYREFRQDNNFWYFTGISTPNAVLVMEPGGREYFLVPPVNPGSERWLGDLIDPDEAREITGIEDCLSLGSEGGGFRSGVDESGLEKLLDRLAKKYHRFYIQEAPAENWVMSRDNLQTALQVQKNDPYDGRLSREEQFAAKFAEKHGVEVKDITVLLDRLRMVKTPEEIRAMRRAAQIAGKAHLVAMRMARAGMYEWQLSAAMTAEFLKDGAMGPAYMAITGSGPNSCILHYPEGKRKLGAGEVVLIDYAPEFNHYASDITRTWPVSGKFSKRQRAAYQAVYDAQEAAFKECRPGSNLGRVGRAAQAVVTKRGFGAMWHGTSHYIGMATHDDGAYGAEFVPGMVFTVEPGIYLPDEGFGIRIEDMVAITADGYELLSKGIPRKLEEIEAIRSGTAAPAGQ